MYSVKMANGMTTNVYHRGNIEAVLNMLLKVTVY